MKTRNAAVMALILGICSLIYPAGSFAEDVKIEDVSFQEVLDKLFGTPTTPGLLAGDKHFDLRAEGVSLTEEQAILFFNPSDTNTSDFADLIAAAEQLKSQLRIEGILPDGDTFQFRMSGKQVKAEGLVLTQAEFDALIAELKSIPSLKEAKIEALVDGKLLVAKLENQPGRVKIEDRGAPKEGHGSAQERKGPNSKSDQRLEASNRGRGDRPEKPAKIERVEKVERAARPEKIERVERGGPGKR